MERIVNLHLEKLSEGFYLAIGENEHLCREAWAKNHIGDNMTLDLFGEQNELAEAITALGKPELKKNIIKKGESVKVSVEVKNTGKIQGDEIVQMYIRDVASSVTRPVKKLKGFARISLNPGESKKVTFEITPEKLAFHNVDMKFVVEPGAFEIMTGPSSREQDLQKTVLTVK
jgi:hypothetical protein